MTAEYSTWADLDRIFNEEGVRITFDWYSQDDSYFAVCSQSGNVAKVAGNSLSHLIVRDALTVPGWCEEGQRCLDFSCPANKTTEASLFREYRIIKSQLPSRWRTVSQRLTKGLKASIRAYAPDLRGKRQPIRPRQRFRILLRDKFRCQACGKDATIAVLHIDHVIPVSAGGGNDDDNLQTLCQECNLGKADIW